MGRKSRNNKQQAERRERVQSSGGNRCGHDPHNPRFCDVANRGKGGQPGVIGLISSLLQDAFIDRSVLNAWQEMNESGRKRRTESIESMVSVTQFMIAKWFQLETRRCASPGFDFLTVPDVAHIRNQINETSDWASGYISEDRINTVFSEFNRCGYITSKQVHSKKADGTWKATPAIRTFTKKFFVELGGESLWKKIRKAGQDKVLKIKEFADRVGMKLNELLSPGWIVPPYIARKLQKTRSKPRYFVHTEPKVDPNKVRQSAEYQVAMDDKLIELACQHPPDAPPGERWTPEECLDNAKRIINKQFGI